MPSKATKRRLRSDDSPTPVTGAPPRPLVRGEKTYPGTIARPLTRLYAWTLDAGIIVLLVLVLSRVTQGAFFSREAAPQDIFLFLAYFIIPTGLWGRTLGKWVAGIIVVNSEGHTPGVAAAIGREFGWKVISYGAAGIGLVWIIFDRDRRSWHDKLAGTWVVNVPDAGAPIFGKLFRKL